MASPFARLKRLFRRDQAALTGGSGGGGGGRALHSDGYANIITGLSTARDKRMAAFSSLEVVTDIDARQMWRSDDMAKRVIETLPREAMRRGYEIKAQDKEISEEISAAAEALDLDGNVRRAAEFERAYGGAALLPVLDGPIADWKLPLVEKNITEVLAFHVLEPRELFPQSWYANLTDKKFGMPRTYRCIPMFAGGMMAPETTTMVEIHESRLVIFPGTRVTRLPQPGTLLGWGDNVLTVMSNILRDYGQSWGMAASLLSDFAQGVLSIDGLDQMAVNDQGDVARDRLIQMNILRSFMNAMVIDRKDTFTRIQTPMTGLPELLREMATRLAAAADMPVTLLMGMSPAGLNATGESDRDFWFDRVAGLQHRLTPIIRRLIGMIIRSSNGPTGGVEPKMWSVEWKPLDMPTEKEVADTNYVIAQTDDLNIKNKVYSAEDAATSHYGGDTFSPGIVIDWDARAAQQKADEDAEAAEAAAALLRPQTVPGALPPGGTAALPAAPSGDEDAVPIDADPKPEPPEKQTRQDFDPDQARDSDGKFGSTGGRSSEHAARAASSQGKAMAAAASGDHDGAAGHLKEAVGHAQAASAAKKSELAAAASRKAPGTSKERKHVAAAHESVGAGVNRREAESQKLTASAHAATAEAHKTGEHAKAATMHLEAAKAARESGHPRIAANHEHAAAAHTTVASTPAEHASAKAGEASAHAMATGEKKDHAAAGEAHRGAEDAHHEVGNKSKAEAHGAAAEHHEKESGHGGKEHEGHEGKEEHEKGELKETLKSFAELGKATSELVAGGGATRVIEGGGDE